MNSTTKIQLFGLGKELRFKDQISKKRGSTVFSRLTARLMTLFPDCQVLIEYLTP
jgi:hypothetical protein